MIEINDSSRETFYEDLLGGLREFREKETKPAYKLFLTHIINQVTAYPR